MEFLTTIARSYKKSLHGLYEKINGFLIWIPRKFNPGTLDALEHQLPINNSNKL